MCVIIVAKKHKVDKSTFKKAWDSNPDGFGMAWREKGEVHYKKGMMTLKEAQNFYYSRDFALPHVLHFRIASIGEVCPELTHPFVLGWDLELEGETKKGVLFQNGTASSALHYIIDVALMKGMKIPQGKWNDARALGVLVRELGINVLNFIDPGKVVIFTPNKLNIFGDFDEINGNLFSNLYWRNNYIHYNDYNFGVRSYQEYLADEKKRLFEDEK